MDENIVHQRAEGYSPSMQGTMDPIAQAETTNPIAQAGTTNPIARADTPSRHGLRAFGLSVLTDMPPPGAWVAVPLAEPVLHLRSSCAEEIAQRWSGFDAIGWEGTIDGAPFVVERGHAGDHRLVHGEHPDPRGAPTAGTRAVHHLSADAAVLRCAPPDLDELTWWRVVLDSALFTVALLHGYEALHAGAIATPEGAIAITATTGGGKSTLLSELLNDGLTLVTDDVLVLESRGEDAPLAHPGAPLMTVSVNTHPPPGAPIASIAEERWMSVRAHRQALPLSALVVLNRRMGLATSLHRAHNPLAVLIGSLLRFPRVPERERARFELAAALAAHVPIWELSADPRVTPAALARLLREELIGIPLTPIRGPTAVA